MSKIRIAGYVDDSIVDGPGIRFTIFTQGCAHHCFNCHNPETWDFDKGKDVDIDELISKINRNPLLQGITLSGGDPVCQAEACYEISKAAHSMGLNVWCYTGYTYEEMLKNPKAKKLLSEVDVLVDGKFILEEKSLDIYFRGSRNQRIIDVPKSLEQERIVLVDKYMQDKSYDEPYKKPDYMFI